MKSNITYTFTKEELAKILAKEVGAPTEGAILKVSSLFHHEGSDDPREPAIQVFDGICFSIITDK